MKLGPYTKAINCTDVADCDAGIQELNNYFTTTPNPKPLAYRRLAKLQEKREELINKGSQVETLPLLVNALETIKSWEELINKPAKSVHIYAHEVLEQYYKSIKQ